MYIFCVRLEKLFSLNKHRRKKNARSRIILTHTGNSLTKAVFMDVEGR